jgi:hypothetical protein
MRTVILIIGMVAGMAGAIAQEFESPKRISEKSKVIPENEWFTYDGETMYYVGEEWHVAEYCWIIIYEADADWNVDTDARDHDTTVHVKTKDFEVDAPVWYLSNGYTLISINKIDYGTGTLVMKKTKK